MNGLSFVKMCLVNPRCIWQNLLLLYVSTCKEIMADLILLQNEFYNFYVLISTVTVVIKSRWLGRGMLDE